MGWIIVICIIVLVLSIMFSDGADWSDFLPF